MNNVELSLVPSMVSPPMPTTLLASFDDFIARMTVAGFILSLLPEFSCIDSTLLSSLESIARDLDPNADLTDLTRFYRVFCPTSDAAKELAELMLQWSDVVEDAYSDSLPLPPQVTLSGEVPPGDYRAQQGYRECAPIGVDALMAGGSSITQEPGIPGGRGDGVSFALIDDGWWRNHDDLSDPPVEIVFGFEKTIFDERLHGNASLGVVAARMDNDHGCDGISSSVSAKLLTQWDDSVVDRLPCTILRAVTELFPLDVCPGPKCPPSVLLIEAHRIQGSASLPVETDPATYAAIRLGTALGIAIIEPAGNGGVDLDDSARSHPFYDAQRSLHVREVAYGDSLAIMVGATTSRLPHELHHESNRGQRIDCYAWGDSVVTVGSVPTNGTAGGYYTAFGETSAATAIVAGVASSLRGIANAAGTSLTVRKLRELLSNRELNTPVYATGSGASNSEICYHESSPVFCSETDGCIGVMPDLRRMIASIT